MTKEHAALAKKLQTIDIKIDTLEKQKKVLIDELVKEHCPHKVGQKVSYHRGLGVYETLVCVSIKPNYLYNGFIYRFKRLRRDGRLEYDHDVVYKELDLEWLNEHYKGKIEI